MFSILSLRDFFIQLHHFIGMGFFDLSRIQPFALVDGFALRALEIRNWKLTCDIPTNHFFKLRRLQYFYFATFCFDEAFVLKIR